MDEEIKVYIHPEKLFGFSANGTVLLKNIKK